MKQVLVTGGAGYIGSHIVRELLCSGHDPIVLDDLSAGHREAVGDARLVQADFADAAVLDDLLGDGVDFVIHMAAFSEVGRSMSDPASYYRNNLIKSLQLLEAARRHRVGGVVFSSTAAVYGDPTEVPIREVHPLSPTSPYGETKLSFERALEWYRRAYDLPYVSLRYFNAAGAHPDGDIGEDHAQETHLVPRLLRAACEDGGGEPVPVFGEDYPTRDGTCVRDYVHVVDLARAHVQALERLERSGTGTAFNLGNGEGFTVREVIAVVERVVGARLPTTSASRRPGDPAVLVASSERARSELGWTPGLTSLEEIVGSAWRWHGRHPRGYAAGHSPSLGSRRRPATPGNDSAVR